MAEALTESELSIIHEHMRAHALTLALVKTERAPGELTPILEDLERRLGVKLLRTYSSPMSDFCTAELHSDHGGLVMLFIAGERTELVSVSETDEVSVKDLEDSIHYSNFHSEIMRHGL